MKVRPVMSSESEEEALAEKNEVFKHSSFYLHFVGLWKKDGQTPDSFSIIRGYFGALNVIGIFVFQFSLLTRPDLNGEVIAEFIAEFLLAKTAISKVLPIILNRKNVIKIWQETYKINVISQRSSTEKEIVDGWRNYQCKVVRLFVRFAIVSLLVYQIVPWIDGSKFPLKGILPEWAESSSWFYLVYTIMSAASALRCITVTACDLCSIIVMCQLFGQLQVVQRLIEEIAENDVQSLRRIIIRHIDVLDYGRVICDNFTLTLVFQHYDIAMGICCLGAVALYTKKFALIMNLMFFIVSYATELAIIGYTGEKVIVESSKIASNIENAYDKFTGDVSSFKLIHIMLIRAQEPLKFRFGSTKLCLNYYCQTINTIYSFFMVLKSLIV